MTKDQIRALAEALAEELKDLWQGNEGPASMGRTHIEVAGESSLYDRMADAILNRSKRKKKHAGSPSRSGGSSKRTSSSKTPSPSTSPSSRPSRSKP